MPVARRLHFERTLQQSAPTQSPAPLVINPNAVPTTSEASNLNAADMATEPPESTAGTVPGDGQAADVPLLEPPAGADGAASEAEAQAPGEVDPKKVVIVNSAREFAFALSRNEQHIEVRSHFVFNPYESYDESYRVETRQPAEKDGWEWHTDPSTSNIKAHLQVGAPVRSIRGNCVESFNTVFEDLEEDSVAGLTKRGTQCLLLLQSEPADHSTLVDLLSEVKSELPLWLDSIYFANTPSSVAAVAGQVFMWASRDVWMTNVTMHADRDTPSQAMWVDDFGVLEECDFKDFLPRHGHSVVTVVRSEVALSACDFRGCQVTNGAQGLVGSIGNGTVAVSGLVAGEDCCNVKFWNYSNQTADSVPLPIDGPVLFASGTAEAVGGSGAASLTAPLQGLQGSTFLQQDTFAERRLAVEQEATSSPKRAFDVVYPDAFASTPGGILSPPRGGPGGETISVALLASLICAVTLLGVTVLAAALLWLRHRGNPRTPSNDKEVLVRRIDVGAATDSEVLDVMMPTHASSSAPPNKNSDEEHRDADTSLLLPPQELPDQQAAADRTHGPHARAGSLNSQDPVSTLSLTSTNRPTIPGQHASSAKRRAYLEYQLDSMHGLEVLGGLRFQTGVDKRLNGGQAVVQIAEDVHTHQQYAVKFFLFKQAFEQEARLYEDPDQPLGRFLPECRAIFSPFSTSGCHDKHGNPLPPCIVMEKGEALDKWAARSDEGVDFVTGLQVLTHVAERLKDLHAAGYVHRDIKPGNIMWLPRKNRWTLIDFGCAAETDTFAFSGFSVFFAPPELLAVFIGGQGCVQATEALDAWSVGILALEMFCGRPVWNHKTCSKYKVVAQILWGLAPWEDPATAPRLLSKLGHFRCAVLALLNRDPSARPSMAQFQRACSNVLREPQSLRSARSSNGASSCTGSAPITALSGVSSTSKPYYHRRMHSEDMSYVVES